ncbi:trypsin-like peptidase domain-containing protein [Actinoplanes solisilvae]|uniref:trypsin-like peptidase domain-containing protein n=1 Tax=Actinoplanes solisilvae TaxID=2486853 RepID=UPI000FD7A989|nr:trypsin-like peptidase domain-containing protein [Actinoplanes solisilvae]
MHEPPSDGWAVALHDAEGAETSIGSGLVVDTNLVLTCAHVAFREGRAKDLWVSFPMADVGFWERRRVRQCLVNGMPDEHVDLALLELVDPVPAEVTPATVRLLTGRELLERPWWAYGYPATMPSGYSTHGRVSGHRGHGKVHLATESDSPVAKGFSGAAVWSPDYQAVVGIVLEAQNGKGDAQALTFRHADDRLPALKLGALAAWQPADADETALAAWGWALVTDEEAGRHWLPRARGVAVAGENGHRFRGRHNALHRLVGALDHPYASGRPLIVTGSPGVGKSAVLGRLVTTADPALRSELPADDTLVRATPGSVACAVHAKGKSALDVAAEIARAAGVGLPAAPVDVVSALRDRLADRPARFNLIVDALDEAADPEQARSLVREVLIPLAHDGRAAGIQVLVGTRRLDSDGDLLAEFGPEPDVVDLDAPEFFAEADLVDYTEATLRLLGDPRPGNPYATAAVARPVAHRIARFARQNFLVAGLVARAHALNDSEPVGAGTTFAGDMASALSTYLDGLPPVGGASARLVLTALAYAEPPGLNPMLWQAAVAALGGTSTEDELRRFARTSAANFLVEKADPAGASYRLFHQALNDELTSERAGDRPKLVRAWASLGRRTGWAAAPGYLLRFLPVHAAQAGMLDELLTDDDFLLHAELDRVLRVAGAASTERGRARVALLQRTPAALAVSAPERSALFSVVDRLDGLGAAVSADGAPYYAAWTHARPRQERTVLEGHSQAVYDVASIPVQGRNLLASAGEDGDVRFWDPLTNQSERVLHCHDDCVRSLCAVRVGTETLLATAGHDGTVRLWDPVSRQMIHELRGHAEWVRNVCTIPGPDGDLLASAGDDWSVRIWNPATGTPVRTLIGHTGWVTAVTHVPVGRRHLVASTGYDSTVRLWDPRTGDELLKLAGHIGWVTTLYAVTTERGTLIASAGYDGTVRLWDPVTGAEAGRFETGGPMTDLCTVGTPGGLLLAATGEDGAIRIWDVATGRERTALRGHASWIRAVCELPISDRRMLATAGDDGTVRLWDPDGDLPGPVRDGRRLRDVTSLCTVTFDGRDVVASTGSDGSVRLWDPADGTELDEYSADAGTLNDLCAADNDGETLLVAAGGNGTVQLWSAGSGLHDAPMTAHFDSVNAVRALPAADGTMIASAGDDVTIRLWRPHDKVVRENLTGHTDWVTALAVTVRDGRPALASADKNGTVRLWDSDGAALWTEHGHSDAVNALCTVGPLLASAGADSVIRLWDPEDGRPHDPLLGHVGEVKGLCAVPSAGGELLASVGADRTVRLWDPATGRMLRAIPVHHPALSCHFVAGRLIVGLSEGLIALAVDGCGNH